MGRSLLATALLLAVSLPPVPAQQQQRECECVSYWLCENGRIVTDGTNLLDVRQKTCPGVEVCCLVDDSPPSPTARPLDPVTRPQPPVPKATPTPSPITPNNRGEQLKVPLVASGGGCGRRRLEPDTEFKVTGPNGSPDRTFYGEAPWMVVLLRAQGGSPVFTCGGTLITPSVVLTAAHCVNDTSQGELTVRAGEYDNRIESKPIRAQTRGVSRVTVHPQYNGGNLQNDIAVLVLEEPMQLNEVIDVVCGPEGGVDVNPKGCFVTGWGRNSSQGRYQSAMSKVNLELRDRDYCQNTLRTSRLGKHFILHEGFICAGGGDARDTCAGDGGGPLVCPSRTDPNKMIQMGIVSWGIGCGDGYPTVLVSVPNYIRWIASQIPS